MVLYIYYFDSASARLFWGRDYVLVLIIRLTLHGIPVGIKDIVNTEFLPTENGTVLAAKNCIGKRTAGIDP